VLPHPDSVCNFWADPAKEPGAAQNAGNKQKVQPQQVQKSGTLVKKHKRMGLTEEKTI